MGSDKVERVSVVCPECGVVGPMTIVLTPLAGSLDGMDSLNFSTLAAIPEPATFALLAFGFTGLGFSRRKQ